MHDDQHSQPTRRQALVFAGKAKILQGKRVVEDTIGNVRRHAIRDSIKELLIVGRSSTSLWTEEHESERELTAGKIQNLRVAANALHGVVIPAGQILSFWKQLGRVTRKKGYVVGRELREGCIIPNLGGGLCQLSNGLYNAALKAGFKIAERHAHSLQVPGSLAEVGRDATVFWNYVDLRFSHTCEFQISVKLSKNHLHIELLSREQGSGKSVPAEGLNKKMADGGNCLSCGVTACFRNVPYEELEKSLGMTSYLLDSYAPELDLYLSKKISGSDQVMLPIHAKRWRAPAYRWSVPQFDEGKPKILFATRLALARAFKLRSLPPEGGALQKTLAKYDRKLAQIYASHIDYGASHLVVSQNLLPHLWELGVMGGRTFDVLATRYPLEILQAKLDEAAEIHPESPTLSDFRVPRSLAESEADALRNARHVITSHVGVGASMVEQYESNIITLDWVRPEVERVKRNTAKSPDEKLVVGFPASPLGKKGVYELCDAIKSLKVEVLILGKAEEGVQIPNSRHAGFSEILKVDVLVLPAYIEHSPRFLLRGLGMGIPVIASEACGIPSQKGLTLIDAKNGMQLRKALLLIMKDR